jgi:hypothetical protein
MVLSSQAYFFESFESASIYQILAALTQAGSKMLCSEIHELLNSVGNNEKS